MLIYLDHCATTPMSDKALSMFIEASKRYFGNPNSLHDEGLNARSLLEEARKTIAQCINGEPERIYFTGGGSDSNNLVIRSLVKGRKGHIITTSTEHFSVTNTTLQLEEEGYEITFLDVDRTGLVSLDRLMEAIKDTTILVSICHANSDIGTIQNVAEIGAFLQKKKIVFHTDCVQSFGKIPIDVKKLNIHAISMSSHKIYGPKGVGAVYISPNVNWKPLIPFTNHEKGFRAGTINVPGIASFAEAAIQACDNLLIEEKRLSSLSALLLQLLQERNIPYTLIGHKTSRLSHHLSICIDGIEGQYMMLELNKKNIAVSTGTACKVGEQNASQTMIKLGYSNQKATELIRISLGKSTNEDMIIETANAISTIYNDFFYKG